jgi:phosphoribosylamine--glycine ligase
MTTVLVVGSGAREHALVKSFLKSEQVDRVIVSPGNDGMMDAGLERFDVALNDLDGLLALAQEQNVDLTMVGSEEPLVLGIVDLFQSNNQRIFGPSKAAAQLEGSKSFTKDLLTRHHIPTAQAHVVTNIDDARAVLAELSAPIVFKLDGLALGKGVTVVHTMAEAKTYLDNIYQQSPNEKLVIEEFLAGVEFSIFSLVGENGVVHAPIAQDHKRLLDGDQGPNTGGMGAYSPVRWLSDEDIQTVITTLVQPSIAAMKADGTPFTGILYTGVMLTKQGPKVIEFNVRFGDPEAQVVLPQLQSDLYDVLTTLLAGGQPEVHWQTENVYLGVVLASPGYPVSPEKGLPVPNVENIDMIDYAGVKLVDEALVSNGGRVATVVAHGKTATQAQDVVYQAIDATKTVLTYRHDIGYQAVNAEQGE